MITLKEKVLLISITLSISYFSLEYIAQDVKDRNLSELALGRDTTTYYAHYNENKIHCEDVRDANECISPYRASGKENTVLLFGNSQLHAINQMSIGNKSAPFILHEKLINTPRYLMTFSQPNSNLQEHYVLFKYLLNKINIETLVLPVFFDDMREDGIRPGLLDAFKDDKTSLSLNNTKIGKYLVSKYLKPQAEFKDDTYFSKTIQADFEKYIGNKLMEFSDLWADRSDFDSFVWIYLYKFRNYIFDINPSTKRKKIQSRYDNNLSALTEILKAAKKGGINIILYIHPIRYDVPIPYDKNEYRDFKRDIALRANAYNYKVYNYENLVPPEMWGLKDSTTVNGGSEVDFMHFQTGGHKELAYKLLEQLTIIGNKKE